jgi:hypothetical protein
VDFAEGKVYMDIQHPRERPRYILSVGPEKFSVPKDLFLSLSNRQEYRVYYSPHSRYVLGADPL